jgi:hypothetical protein
MAELSFQDLITPLESEAFFGEYWQKKVLWSPSSDQIRTLISLADIEFLLSSLTTPGPNWVQVVKAGKPLALRSYATGESFVSLPKVYGAYQAGYTIQLAKMHKRWRAVGALCRAAEIAFTEAGVPLSTRIGSHLYLTPAHSTGLEPHYDNHDVIVVQVEGVKHWKVYGSLDAFPIDMQIGSVPRDQLPPLEQDIPLEAGQILYIPRGVFHEASTEDQHSVHITLDITPYNWTDLLYRVMREDARFREALPVGSWTQDGASETLRSQLRERLTALADHETVDRVARAMFDGFLEYLDTLPQRGLEQLHQLESVGPDTILRRRPGAYPSLLKDGGKLKLRFPGSGFQAPEGLESLFEALLQSSRFAVRDLPDLLAEESKVEVARELIREGFLEIETED